MAAMVNVSLVVTGATGPMAVHTDNLSLFRPGDNVSKFGRK